MVWLDDDVIGRHLGVLGTAERFNKTGGQSPGPREKVV